MNEPESWKKQEVYFQEEDISHSCISVRQVLRGKIKKGEKVTKARLCVSNFKEIKDFPTDSPCLSRIGVGSVFVLITSNRWKVQIIDDKAAVLQSKQTERTVYFRPPKEANTNKI